MSPGLAPTRLRVVAAFAAVYLVWGSTYLAIRFAIETLPPFWMAAARFLTAGGLLYAWARWRGEPAPRPAPSSITIHSGTVATSRAASPEGTRCSAHTTPPLPPSSSNPPTTNAERQCTGRGAGSPRHRAQA